MATCDIDCRGMTVPESGLAILKAYNAAEAGARLAALTSGFPPGLRMWLIEAGVKHEANALADGSWRVSCVRGFSPGQGTIPGLHHLEAAASGVVWTCERDARLVQVDGDSGELRGVAPVAKKASHLAVSPDGRWVFIADPGDSAMLAVRTDDMSVRHKWQAPGTPQLPLATEAGFVCVTGPGTGTLTIVSPKVDGFAERIIEVGSCPHDPIGSADGRAAFVPCAGDGEIVHVDLESGRILGRYPAGDGCSHLALHPDGSRLYSANTFDGTVSCLSVEGDLLARAESGQWAHQPEITPDGALVYVANFLDDSISVFGAETLDERARLDCEAYPHSIDISPDGRFLVAAGYSSDHLRVYDAARHAEHARIKVGPGSSHTCFVDNGQQALVACSVSDHLARIDLEAGRLLSTLQA